MTLKIVLAFLVFLITVIGSIFVKQVIIDNKRFVLLSDSVCKQIYDRNGVCLPGCYLQPTHTDICEPPLMCPNIQYPSSCSGF